MNALNWFEIPVANLARAQAFWEKVLDTKMKRETFAGSELALFPYERPGVGGALMLDARRKPGGGTLVYLDATGKIDECLDRVEAAGGKVVVPRTAVGDVGFIGLVEDSEGNTVGLHAAP